MSQPHFRRRLATLVVGAVLTAAAGPVALANTEAQGLIAAARDDLAADVAAKIRARADVNARDELGGTALAWAVIRNNEGVVKQLLDAGADPDLRDVNGVGPLALAVASDAGGIVRLLLEKGADPNLARSSGETPLMTAARLGSTDNARMLLAHGAAVNVAEAKFGQTALMWATGHPEIVRMLLDKGADPQPVTKAWEVTATNYTPITFTLGVTGIPWNNDGEYRMRAGGENALMFAVRKHDLESARMLLVAGLDVNQRSADGTTPLLAALYNWRHDDKRALAYAPDFAIANLLLDKGAKVDVADEAGYTPLHGALLAAVLQDPKGALALSFNPGLNSEPRRPRPKPPANEAEVLALARRLLEAGADPNAATVKQTPGPVNMVRINPCPPGSTPYHVAAASHSARLVDLLAAHGADANRVREDGHTPFSLAALDNDLPVVKALVAHGADLKKRYDPIDELSDDVEPKTEPRKGQTILHIAAVSGGEWVVGYLAEKGVPLDARNNLGETPLDLALAQETYRFSKDSEGPVGVAEAPKVERETQTSDAFRRALKGSTRAAADPASQPGA